MNKQIKNSHFDFHIAEIKKDYVVNKSLYLLLLPVIAYYIIFSYVPLYGALIAFMDYTPGLGMSSNWVGFKHFVTFFTSPSFGILMRNTLRISLSTLVVTFPAPIILALLFNELKSQRFSKIIQNASYLPHFISLVVVCGIIKDFTSDSGVVTAFLSLFGVPKVSLLNYPKYFVPVYVVSEVWKGAGWGSIIYLAALTGIDASLYEAATIDGAGRFKQLIHVTLPGISSTIIMMLIIRLGNVLTVGYEKLILLYNDATLEVADVISTYVYRKGLLEQNWSFSTAVGLFNSAVNLILLFATNFISRKVSDYGLW